MTIYTFTPNPALDLSGHVHSLLANEKNYVFRQRRDPGGNSINVARVTTRLGVRTEAFGFLGGPTGAEIRYMLSEEGVHHDFTEIHGNTRTNVTVTNDADHLQTRLTFPGPPITRAEIQKLLRKVKTLKAPGLLVMGGSLPQGCPNSIYGEVGAIAAAKGIPAILDAPVPQMKASLGGKFHPLLIKPNIVELEELTRRKLKGRSAILAAGKALAEQAELVCISLGSKGALLVSRFGAWEGTPPKVRARGTVGAGDSMVGAMAARLVHHRFNGRLEDFSVEKLQDVFAWGMAAGAASAEAEGTAMATRARIQALSRQVSVREL